MLRTGRGAGGPFSFNPFSFSFFSFSPSFFNLSGGPVAVLPAGRCRNGRMPGKLPSGRRSGAFSAVRMRSRSRFSCDYPDLSFQMFLRNENFFVPLRTRKSAGIGLQTS